MKIMLVDDEQSLLDVYSQILLTAGFQVTTASSGTDALAKLKLDKPDMILLDQVLPDINGNQILQMLKQDPATQQIPVAILSNFNQDGMLQDAINLGAVDYIFKYKIEPKDIIEKVQQIIAEHGKPVIEDATPEPVVTQPVTPTAPVSAIPPVAPETAMPQQGVPVAATPATPTTQPEEVPTPTQ